MTNRYGKTEALARLKAGTMVKGLYSNQGLGCQGLGFQGVRV